MAKFIDKDEWQYLVAIGIKRGYIKPGPPPLTDEQMDREYSRIRSRAYMERHHLNSRRTGAVPQVHE